MILSRGKWFSRSLWGLKMNTATDRFYFAHTTLTGSSDEGTYRVEFTSRIARSFDDDRTLWYMTVDYKGNVVSEFFDLKELTLTEIECIKRTLTAEAVLEEGITFAAEFVRDYKHYEKKVKMPIHEKFGQCTLYEYWDANEY